MPIEHKLSVIANAMYDFLNSNAGPLGLNYVGKWDEKRLPRYPSVVIAPNDRVKSLRGMSTFEVDISLSLWVYHGDMTVPHAVRSEQDIVLVEKIEDLIEQDYTLGGLVVFGYIATQVSGIVQPTSRKSDVIAGTRMDWVAMSQRRLRA